MPRLPHDRAGGGLGRIIQRKDIPKGRIDPPDNVLQFEDHPQVEGHLRAVALSTDAMSHRVFQLHFQHRRFGVEQVQPAQRDLERRAERDRVLADNFSSRGGHLVFDNELFCVPAFEDPQVAIGGLGEDLVAISLWILFDRFRHRGAQVVAVGVEEVANDRVEVNELGVTGQRLVSRARGIGRADFFPGRNKPRPGVEESLNAGVEELFGIGAGVTGGIEQVAGGIPAGLDEQRPGEGEFKLPDADPVRGAAKRRTRFRSGHGGSNGRRWAADPSRRIFRGRVYWRGNRGGHPQPTIWKVRSGERETA